jgi:hypothetical protein
MNIKKIIAEELKSLIKEDYESNDFNFQEPLKATYYGYEHLSNEYDVDINSAEIILKWGIKFHANAYGIETMSINVNSVDGMIKIEYHDKISDEITNSVDKNINEFKWNFVIANDAMLENNSSLYAYDLDFYFKEMTCTVNFH